MEIRLCSPLLRLVPMALAFSIHAQVVFADILEHWTVQQVSTNRFGLDSVVYGNGQFVAAGSYSDYGAIISSPDGYHWIVRADGFNSWPAWGLSVHFAGGQFIAVSAWGGTGVSSDGINWTFSGAPNPAGGASPLYLSGA